MSRALETPSSMPLAEVVPDLVHAWLREDADAVRRWQDHGADPTTVAFYLVRKRLDEIIERGRGRHQHLLVASFPKSASTFTRKLLATVTGFRPYFLSHAGNDSSRDLDPTSIPLLLGQDTVSVEYLRATRQAVDLLRRLEIRPIVLVRDLHDTLVSSRDHLRRMPGARGAVAHGTEDLHAWEPDDQHWFLVRMVAPWYLNFFTSWQDAARELDTLWITYDDITRRPEQTVRRALAHAGINGDDDRIAAAVASLDLSDVRFNRGVSGRGRAELSAAQQQALADLAASYRGSYDFSLLGLAGSSASDATS